MIEKSSEQASGTRPGIGFIGVGSMGSAIAERLLREHKLLVNDANPSAADDLVAKGAIFASLESLADSCQFVFTCLPRPSDVVEVLLGSGGVAQRLRQGSVVIDMTSGTPTTDVKIAAELQSMGIDYADVPISGRVSVVRDGAATLMAGASPEAFAKIVDLLHCVTSEVFHVGEVGAGHTMKLVNNFLNNCNRFATLEAVRLGEKCGLGRDVIIDVLNKSSGRNNVTQVTFPQYLAGPQYKLQGFSLGLMKKDIHLANELAREVGHDTPIGTIVEELTGKAVTRFGDQADQSQLMAEWYEAAVGDPS